MTSDLADRVQRSFSRSFASYHEAALQQAWIAGQLVQELRAAGAAGPFTSALELGCGTGHLTRRLTTGFDISELTLNDISPQAQGTARAHQAAFLCGDAGQIDWPEKPDLIVSASMIQWLRDPARLLQRAAESLAPGGWLAVSGFGPEQYRELVKIGSSSGAPGLCRAEDLAEAVRGKLEVVSACETLRPMTFETPRKVLEHLRNTGVNGRAAKRWSKSSLAAFSDDYMRYFGAQDGVSLTYHLIWMVARRPA